MLKAIGKNKPKTIKDMKDNYKIIWRVYDSIYSNIVEQFKIYLDSLPESEKDQNEKDFCANGNGVLTIQDS